MEINVIQFIGDVDTHYTNASSYVIILFLNHIFQAVKVYILVVAVLAQSFTDMIAVVAHVETLTYNCITDKDFDMLNSPISEDEVKKAVKRLKNGKACGEDKILNEMIKAFSETHMGVLTNIFNIVLQSGHMPDEWVIGIIKPIYKNKGDINDPDNYRGITLLSCF